MRPIQHLPRIVRVEQALVESFRGNFCKRLTRKVCAGSPMHKRLGNVARRRNCKPFSTRRVCLCLEQVEEKTGVGWGIVVTRYVSHGKFTKGHAESGICREITGPLRQ